MRDNVPATRPAGRVDSNLDTMPSASMGGARSQSHGTSLGNTAKLTNRSGPIALDSQSSNRTPNTKLRHSSEPSVWFSLRWSQKRTTAGLRPIDIERGLAPPTAVEAVVRFTRTDEDGFESLKSLPPAFSICGIAPFQGDKNPNLLFPVDTLHKCV